jgi:3-methyladenine DNA glycosylase AlkD
MTVRVSAAAIRARIRGLANPTIGAHSARFFKSGPGEYGAGDRFLGVRVPDLRRVAREFRAAPLGVALALLRSPLHEERLLALVLLVERFERGDENERARIYAQCRKHTPRYVNNWDLVDSAAYQIVGAYLEARDRGPLYELARSPSLWERRVAIIATFGYIKKGAFDDTLALSRILLGDREVLIHKAAGWMLREVGNCDRTVLERFLSEHYAAMPRTMLRYAIDKLPERRRLSYLRGIVRTTATRR